MDLGPRLFLSYQLFEMLFQSKKSFRICKEAGHSNNEFSEDSIDLVRVLLQQAYVILDTGRMGNLHPPLDTTVNRGSLIDG